VAERAGLLVRLDVHPVDLHLAVAVDLAVRPVEAHLALPHRLHLGALQDDARLQGLLNVVLELGLLIAFDDLDAFGHGDCSGQ